MAEGRQAKAGRILVARALAMQARVTRAGRQARTWGRMTPGPAELSKVKAQEPLAMGTVVKRSVVPVAIQRLEATPLLVAVPRMGARVATVRRAAARAAPQAAVRAPARRAAVRAAPRAPARRAQAV